MRLMEEMQDRPEAFRVRSLRRRLTKLDRALTDEEAYSLDRANNAWLVFHGRSRSVSFDSAGGGGEQQAEPLNQKELNEANSYARMRKRLSAYHRAEMEFVFRSIAPWAEHEANLETDRVKNLAKAIHRAYEQKKNLH